MKLFTRWLPALLIAALLSTPTALMEEAAFEASDPGHEAPVCVDPVDDTVEETEAALDGDAPVDEAPELDLDGEATDWASEDNAKTDPEPIYWTDAPLADDDALFEGYVRGLFGLNPPMLFEARNIGGDLNGAKRTLYNVISGCVSEIAAGRRASTEIAFTNTDGLSPDDVLDVIRCVTADHPYEMYWYANSAGVSFYGDSITVSFKVGSAYSAGEYTFNTSTVATAARAAANARAIVGKYVGRSDYDKLKAYRDEICNAVRYNYDAASTGWDRTRNDPWQVIWVFDGDLSTNVVCEGYAKAFQYLCDMTAFSGDVACYCATGYTDGGAHMWNIVRMPNGRNYAVDVTQCDNDNGNYDWLFMKAPVSGSVSGGYRFHIVNGRAYIDCTYIYDEDLLRVFPESDLTLAWSDYPSVTSDASEVYPGTTELTLGADADDATDVGGTSVAGGASVVGGASVAGIPTIFAAARRVKTTVYAVPGTVMQLDLGGATGKKFKSSKKKVATVSSTGLITVKKAGRTKISFKVGRSTHTVTLTVKDPTVPTAIALNAHGTVAAKAGDSVTLTATLPQGTTSAIKWKSSNKKVATVSNGVVTFKKKGKVTITATATRGKKNARVKFRVSN